MSDFGGKLRLARERRGVSLRQVAASTKIPVSALEALERNDISKLPGGIFSRGFVRSYAIEVGLEPDETVREFLERFHGEPVPATHVAVPVPEGEIQFESQQRMAGVILRLALISIPIIAVVLYFAFRSRPVATAPPNPPPPEQAAAPAVPASGARGTEATTPSGAAMRIEMRPTSACWVRVTVDGTRVMERVMLPGERDARNVRDNVVIEVGDAGAFAFTINGRPGRSLGGSGERKTARITKATMTDFVR